MGPEEEMARVCPQLLVCGGTVAGLGSAGSRGFLQDSTPRMRAFFRWLGPARDVMR